MDINIHIDADERLCRALDNFANTLLSLVIVTEEKRQADEAAKAEAVEKVEAAKAEAAEKVEEKTEEPKPDYKALRAELKSVLAKAAKEGNAESVKALLAELGVSKLSQIPDDVLEEALQKAGDF